MYSKQKMLLLLLVILRYPINKDNQEFTKFESYILHDFEKCPKCFENQSDQFCKRVKLDYEFDENFTDNLNILFGVRHNRILKNRNNSGQRIFAKYLARDFDFDNIKGQTNESQFMGKLSKQFFNETRLNGMQYCPKSEVKRFVKYFSNNYSELSIWTHMIVNMQPILLPHLYSRGFPVPETYASCGFTIFQSFDGISLANLYSSNFIVKLNIARQLLKGALKFTEGFEGFRIYITDLNMDNVVYNQKTNKVSFVDLDTVFIVDGRHNSNSVHKHEFLECYDCFAFSPTDICASGRSDINLFAVCQLLREDLKKDRTKGFLYPVPERYSHLENMLKECVDCEGKICENRFKIAVELVRSIEEIIKNNL